MKTNELKLNEMGKKTFTMDEIIGAFTIWSAEFKTNPDGFCNIDDMTPQEWGARNAVSFLDYIIKYRKSKETC